MKASLSLLLLALAASPALAQEKIELKTNRKYLSAWTVSEVAQGSVISAAPRYAGISPYGHIPCYTIPFKNNDGYWYADVQFTIPAGATNVALHIRAVGVDDRVVAEVNRQTVTSSGTTSSGDGTMTLTDGGPNNAYRFLFPAGPEHRKSNVGFQAGTNDLRLIVNNTNSGINGSPTSNGPTNVGFDGYVSYTMPQ